MRTFLKLTVDCVIFHAAHLLALRCSLSTSAVLVLQQTTDTTVSVALEFGGRLSSTACMWSAWVDYLVQPLHVQIVDACGGVYSNAHSRVRAMCACVWRSVQQCTFTCTSDVCMHGFARAVRGLWRTELASVTNAPAQASASAKHPLKSSVLY
jgi:hypothetical protein